MDASSVQVLGVRIDVLSPDQALEWLATPAAASPRQLAYVNAHSLNLAYTDAQFRSALQRCDLLLNDGVGLALGARMRGVSFPANLHGSDFTLRILRLAARRRWRVFLYGGRPGVAAAAAQVLRARIDQLEIVGVQDGYVNDSPAQTAKKIANTHADVLIVALGQPAQELWLDEYLQLTGCRLGLGVGAFLDFTSGRVPRAPQWMNTLGVEWVFRLLHEPRRLWQRYLIGNPRFLWRAWTSRAADGYS
jgi:exopolysaccharide biosynthesis WecB/TagA/CpsF family protein